MGDRYHGVTENTPYKLVLDSGKVYKNFVDMTNPGILIGATRGGSVFTVTTEYREMPVDGAKGVVKGFRRITKVDAKLKVNFLEITKNLLLDALPGSAVSGTTTFSPEHQEIRRQLNLADENYIDNVVLLCQMSGGHDPIGVGIENALCDGGLELSAVENDESVLSVQFTGHFLPEDLDKEPWFILYPESLTTTLAP